MKPSFTLEVYPSRHRIQPATEKAIALSKALALWQPKKSWMLEFPFSAESPEFEI